jgi:sugar lactone lactonase YvrE
MRRHHFPSIGSPRHFAALVVGILFAGNIDAAQVKADRVLGQATFSTRAPDNGPGENIPFTATSLNGPGGVAVSPVSGKIFVADYFNARVTRYPAAPTITNGMAAEDTVFLAAPGGTWSIFVDKNDALWIADNGAGIVLRYDNASTVPLALTLPSVTFTVPKVEYLFVDARGTLWVTYGLKSKNVNWLANAGTFVSPTPIVPVWTGSLTFTAKADLGGIAVATKGAKKATLWVADAKNNKVYRFDNPANKQSEKNAAAVLGQPKLTDKGAKSGAAGLTYPRSLFLDSKGRLWVADEGANRALRFDNAAKLKTGAKANAVIGQSSFTTKRTGVTSKLIAPYRGGICVDLTGAVWMADDFNNRVLRFTRVPKTK